MKKENLKKAAELYKEIKHLEAVKQSLDKRDAQINIIDCCGNIYAEAPDSLKGDFMQIVADRIKLLEQEVEKL